MLKLTPKPIVLQKLKEAFPKGVSAQRQLDKYVSTLQRMINRAVFKGEYQVAMKWFSVPTSALTHDGGRIGNPPIRVHKWLEMNGFNLIRVKFKGDKNTKTFSKVCFTEFVDVDMSVEDLLYSKEKQFELVAKFATISKAEFLTTYMPILNEDIKKQVDLDAEYDYFPVDSNSLEHYINWLIFRSHYDDAKEKFGILTQALIIQKAFHLFEGIFPQKKKVSDFGRTYYRGVNIQNINKTLRRAALGNYWQYDANSAVFAYKLSMAKGAYDKQRNNHGLTLEETFKRTISLVKDKQSVREMMCKEVFDENFPLSSDERVKVIKQAITAIGFGAQLRVKGWLHDDKEKCTALNKIITNIECRKRFVESTFIKELMVEQKLLNDHIYKQSLKKYPHLLTDKKFLNVKNKPIKNKVLSFAYQTGETQVMDIFRAIAAEGNYEPIANIHDAVIFKSQLNHSRLSYIQETIQHRFGSYWCFEAEKFDGFSMDKKERAHLEADAIAEENERDERLWAEAAANGDGAYKSRWLGDGSALTTEEMAFV